ncbi:hypothetical protein BCR36DRAFT_584635 [Piromyces finnis]|uniref:GDP-mannose transporter n=1 Tax=Piromyces finnis TaxID=1754191 RepID=A0A1Y1V6J2_9FUNG|nr:hypothetical protein BCR36DRAFT_584635 [Piromyces finnis]|eukprot:ORX47942.1 hypothetical protein BCR36DRAFT_584635 [Piromyces finnis]
MKTGGSSGIVQYAVPILAYCCSSICMTVVNKVVLSAYKFKMNFMLLMFQSLIPVLLLEIFTKLRLIPKHRSFKWEEGIKWFPISCGLVVMIYTGSKAVQYLPIPLYTIFKNITIILIAYGERLWFGGSRVSKPMFISFMLMILSSVVGGWADIRASSLVKDKEVGVIRSYFWMFLNCFCCAAYTLFLRSQLKKFNFKDFDTVFYNNLISVPILILCSLVAESGYISEYKAYYFPEDPTLYETRHSEFVGLCTGILISSIASFAISYCSSWCVRVTSSTTYSMVGALNKLPISVAGMIFFDDPVTFGGICGVAIAFASGILFSYAKTHLNNEPKNILPLTTIKDDKEYKAVDRNEKAI